MANSKGGITYRVCFSLCLPMYYMYVHCFSISQPNACTLAFTFPPLGQMCVCTYTHTHRGTLYVPLQTSCIVKENCELLKRLWGSFNLKICIDKEKFCADFVTFSFTSIFRIVLVNFGLSWQHNLYSQIKFQMVRFKVFMIAKS